MNPTDQALVQAYVKSVLYKYSIEAKAKTVDLGSVTGIQYTRPFQQPWPRSFQYQLEFFAADESPAAVCAKIDAYCRTDPCEYVLNVLSGNPGLLIPGYKDIGYLHAWNNAIMRRKLSLKHKNVEPSPEVAVHPICSTKDIAAVNLLQPELRVSRFGLKDPGMINLYATFQGQTGAKAQGIIADPSFLYVADIFTHPDFRRRGLSAALLQTLHQIGIEKGCKYAILLPSKKTGEFELFQRFSYSEAVTIAQLVPEKSPLGLKP